MKAIRIHRNGEPDEMQWEDIQLPAPATGEVRVRHTAIALNFSDVNVRRGGFYITQAHRDLEARRTAGSTVLVP